MTRWIRHAAVLALYTVLAFTLFASVWSAPQQRLAGVGGDPQLVVWLLGWVAFALSHGMNPFFTNFLDYPHGVNLMWNTAFPLLGGLLTPVTMTLGPVFAANLLATLALAFSAWCAYLVLQRYVRSSLAAVCGGLLYGFSPYMVAQSLGHPQLTAAFVPPLLLATLDEIFVRQRRRPLLLGILLGLLASAQLYIGEELLATEALVAAIAVALLLGFQRGVPAQRGGYAARTLVAAGAVFAVLCAFPLGVQFFGPQRVEGTIWGQRLFVSDLLGFFFPTPLQQLAPAPALQISDLFTSKLYEWNSYLGLPLIGLLVYTAIRLWRIRLVQFATLLGLVLALLSMGPVLHVAGRLTPVPVALFGLGFVPISRGALPSRWVFYPFLCAWVGLTLLPVLNNALPGRLMLYVFLLASLLLALFIEFLLTQPPRRRLAMAGLAVLALFPLLPRTPFPYTPIAVPAFFTSEALKAVPDGSVALVAPYSYRWRPTAMIWQATAQMRFRMPEGYALVPGPSFSPPPSALGRALMDIENGKDLPPLTDSDRQRFLDDLAGWQVRTILVGPMEGEQRVVDLFTALLGQRPSEVDGIDVWAEVTALTRSAGPPS